MDRNGSRVSYSAVGETSCAPITSAVEAIVDRNIHGRSGKEDDLGRNQISQQDTVWLIGTGSTRAMQQLERRC